MEGANSMKSDQASPTLCEPDLERETEDDEAVAVDDSTTSSDTDNLATTPVHEPEGLCYAYSQVPQALTI